MRWIELLVRWMDHMLAAEKRHEPDPGLKAERIQAPDPDSERPEEEKALKPAA